MTTRGAQLLGVTVVVLMVLLPGAPMAQTIDLAGAAAPWDAAARSWQELSDRLQPWGITPGVDWVMEGFRNFRGGRRTDQTVAASTLDLNLAFDTEHLLGLGGGEFYIDLEDHGGRDPSEVLVGDLQVFDKLNYSPYLQIFELWYQQKFFDDLVRVKIGKVDANTEFSVINPGLLFVNSSTQVSPTVFVFPTTPDPMPSIDVFFTPREWLHLSFGAFYSNRSVRYLDFSGSPYAIQPTDNGAFLIGQILLTWRHLAGFQAGGDLHLGGWGHTGTFRRFDGESQRGVDGIYAISHQTLWNPSSAGGRGRGLRIFVEYGQTDSSVAPIYQHFGGGLVESGWLWGRAHDAVGVSPQFARLSSGMKTPHSYELALETFYKLELTPQVGMQPDLQYIVNPGGQYPDALVGTLRLMVTL
jgi:porin